MSEFPLGFQSESDLARWRSDSAARMDGLLKAWDELFEESSGFLGVGCAVAGQPVDSGLEDGPHISGGKRAIGNESGEKLLNRGERSEGGHVSALVVHAAPSELDGGATPLMIEAGFRVLAASGIADDYLEADKLLVAEMYRAMRAEYQVEFCRRSG